jgi:hypothetical protein
VQSRFEINTRDDGAVEVVVRPLGARPIRLVGFASQRSAEDWIRMRAAQEDQRPAVEPQLH